MFCWPGYNFIIDELNNFSGNYLEIGVFNGDSIKGIAERYPNKTITGIDPFIEDGYTSHTTNVSRGEYASEQHKNTIQNIDGLSNVLLNVMTSKKFFEELTDDVVKEMNVSIVLIDGSHWVEDVLLDCELAMKLIGDKPGVVVFDDVGLPDVDTAYYKFLDDHKDIIGKKFSLTNEGIWAVYVNEENLERT
jgi:hypothetical protein